MRCRVFRKLKKLLDALYTIPGRNDKGRRLGNLLLCNLPPSKIFSTLQSQGGFRLKHAWDTFFTLCSTLNEIYLSLSLGVFGRNYHYFESMFYIMFVPARFRPVLDANKFIVETLCRPQNPVHRNEIRKKFKT